MLAVRLGRWIRRGSIGFPSGRYLAADQISSHIPRRIYRESRGQRSFRSVKETNLQEVHPNQYRQDHLVGLPSNSLILLLLAELADTN